MNKQNLLSKELSKRILVFDGAMGTQIQNLQLSANDFGGEKYSGCNEYLNLISPQVIQNIHQSYLEAGADIIETNTFGASAKVLKEYGLEDRVEEINFQGARLAREVVDQFYPNKFIAGSIGPTNISLSLSDKNFTESDPENFEKLQEDFARQVSGLIKGGVDFLLLETFSDTLNLKAGLMAIRQVQAHLQSTLPVMISVTVESSGQMLAGQSIEALLASVEHFQPLAVGLNCGTGVDQMREHLLSLSRISPFFIMANPNAGLPDETGRFSETQEIFANKMFNLCKAGLVNIVGGCCGTTPEHIRALVNQLAGFSKVKIFKPVAVRNNLWLSGIDFLEVTPELKPVLVGERTNSIGSKKFRDLISVNRFDLAADIGGDQARNGALIIDLCLANPDRDENADFQAVLRLLRQKTRTPIMIDTTDISIMQNGLKMLQGKSIINSVNFESGESRFKEVAKLASSYGSALIVGTIDEQGMAKTTVQKMKIVSRAYELLIGEFGFNSADIIFDPLVFPLGTGEKEFQNSAVETIKTLQEIKINYPQCATVLGISNCSFGLPKAGREVLNAVYLYQATLASLDIALVNTANLVRYSSLSKEEIILTEDLLFNNHPDALIKFVNYFQAQDSKIKVIKSNLSPEKHLAQCVQVGSKAGLIEALDILRIKKSPLQIVENYLLPAMEQVGRFFREGKLIVAEVLQSAEVMKAAVSYLESFMEKKDLMKNGKMLLATVKGDVHDIGKNLVEIIFANNGYEIIDLGIKVSSGQIIEAVKQYQPDLIGLSGLLVKSCEQMTQTAEDLKNAGIDKPLILGGAALSKNFVDQKVAPAYSPGKADYAKDAMDGLRLANFLIRNNNTSHQSSVNNTAQISAQSKKIIAKKNTDKFIKVDQSSIPQMPFDESKIYHVDLNQLFNEFNLQMLFGKYLGFRGNFYKGLKTGNQQAVKLWDQCQDLRTEIINEGYLKPKALYRFFKAQSRDNQIQILDSQGAILTFFEFPIIDHYSLADFIQPSDDHLAMFIVTSGSEIFTKAHEYKLQGQFLKSHMLQSIALEIAETLSEFTHRHLRDLWQISDGQGERYSFGYSACPNLEDQQKLFDLLQPQNIGVNLTDGYMMDPEASVSALVFHHAVGRFSANFTN